MVNVVRIRADERGSLRGMDIIGSALDVTLHPILNTAVSRESQGTGHSGIGFAPSISGILAGEDVGRGEEGEESIDDHPAVFRATDHQNHRGPLSGSMG